MHPFIANCWRSLNFNQILEERQTLLSLQETDLEKQEEKLMEEHAHDLHSFDGRDLSTGLDELCLCMAGIEDKHATEVVGLSLLVIETSDALIHLWVFPIRDIPLLLKLAQRS
jgi:hypothetical protein